MATKILNLAELAEDQDQAEIAVNEIVRVLDGHSHFGVKDKDTVTPPGSPAEGDFYHLGVSPTGAWSGQGGDIAMYFNSTWFFLTPQERFLMWVDDENILYAYDGSTWTDITATGGGGGSVKQRASITVEGPSATEDLSFAYVDVAVTIAEMAAVLVAPVTSTPSVSWTVKHHTDRSNAGNAVVTAGTTTTSESTGDKITSFNDATIPASSFIWLETTASNLTSSEHIFVSIRYTED
jgi:hypothetical protein